MPVGTLKNLVFMIFMWNFSLLCRWLSIKYTQCQLHVKQCTYLCLSVADLCRIFNLLSPSSDQGQPSPFQLWVLIGRTVWRISYLFLGWEFVKWSILPTQFVQFLYNWLGELRLGSLGLKSQTLTSLAPYKFNWTYVFVCVYWSAILERIQCYIFSEHEIPDWQK